MMCLVRRWQILKFKSVRKSCHSPFQPLFRPPKTEKNQLLAFPSKCNQEKNIDSQKVISFKWNVLISEKKYSCNGYPMPTFQNPIRNATKFSLITDHYRKRPRRESFTWNTGKNFFFTGISCTHNTHSYTYRLDRTDECSVWDPTGRHVIFMIRFIYCLS